jgi:hypothetical protein
VNARAVGRGQVAAAPLSDDALKIVIWVRIRSRSRVSPSIRSEKGELTFP